MICSMFSRAAAVPLLFLMFCPNGADGAVIQALAGATPAATVVPPPAPVDPPCATFGEGGLDFFDPANYANIVRCHNEHYSATHDGRARPIHVLFEASAKTELGAAFGLMKALASQPEKYKVTYLSPGGMIVRRPWGIFQESYVGIMLAPEELPGEHDTVLYESAFPPKKNRELRQAGINVVLKSMLSSTPREKLEAMVLDGAMMFSEPIPEDVSEFSGEKIWIQTLMDLDLPPVDFVVADCFGVPRSVNLLRARAQVPGASWCGNLGTVGMALSDLASTGGVWPMINTQLAARRTEQDPRFLVSTTRELTPVFSAHFLGWGAEGEQPLENVVLEAPEHGAVGPTREVSFQTNQSWYDGHLEVIDQLIHYQMKVPISLVSNLPTTATAVVHQRATGPGADQALLEIKAIQAKMDELRATRLIYIAFGSQGFTFKKAAYKQIIDEAAAVPNAVVFFVVPPAADWEDSPAYPYEPESWRTDYYSATVVGEALTLPENVLLSTWAQQKAIFERFGGPNTVFLTHGGAGSLSEGIANNIALACFPLAFDQPDNCVKASKKGVAVDLRPFAKQMLLEDRTIEGVGGGDFAKAVGLEPDEKSFQGDETPEAGNSIGKRIEHIFAQNNGENENKFQKALEERLEDLKTATYAQDAVVGAFENTMKQQLSLYKEMGLFDGGRAPVCGTGSCVGRSDGSCFFCSGRATGAQ